MAELDAFESGPWGKKFPTVVGAWHRVWGKVIPFFSFPPEVRRVIYTTKAIECVNAKLRKMLKTRGHFPSDDAATTLIWLALHKIKADWTRAPPHWKAAMNQSAILYEVRFSLAAYLDHGVDGSDEVTLRKILIRRTTSDGLVSLYVCGVCEKG